VIDRSVPVMRRQVESVLVGQDLLRKKKKLRKTSGTMKKSFSFWSCTFLDNKAICAISFLHILVCVRE